LAHKLFVEYAKLSQLHELFEICIFTKNADFNQPEKRHPSKKFIKVGNRQPVTFIPPSNKSA